MPVTTTLDLRVTLQLLQEYVNPESFANPVDRTPYNRFLHYVNGTGAMQVNAMWGNVETWDAAGTLFNFTDGSLVNCFGDPLIFTKIKLVYIRHDLTTTPYDANDYFELGNTFCEGLDYPGTGLQGMKFPAGTEFLQIFPNGLRLNPTTYPECNLLQYVPSDTHSRTVTTIIAGNI